MEGFDVFSQATQPSMTQEESIAIYDHQNGKKKGWGKLISFDLKRFLILQQSNYEYILGRQPSSNLRFVHPQVSNKHCSITRIDKDENHCNNNNHHAEGSPSKEGGEKDIETPVNGSPNLRKRDNEGKAKEPEEGTTRKVEPKFERIASADKGLVLLKDFSSNGTYVNGKLIGKGNQVILKHKDLIAVATKNIKLASPELFLIFEDFSEETSDKDEEEEKKALGGKYYLTQHLLGSGNFAQVRLGFNAVTGDKYAVKIINKSKFIQKPKFHENLVMEITILKKLNHPGIVRIHDVIDTSTNVYIFLEFVNGGELFQRISNKGNLDEKTAKLFFHQILQAVLYLHENNIIHRDLKPENLLLDTKDEGTFVKITDFGLAKIVGEESFMKTLCGTPNYIAPEVLSQSKYDKAVDCWSLGVILYAMLAGSLPFSEDDKKTLFSQIKKGQLTFPEEEWKSVSANAKSLIRGLINIRPKERLTVKQALEHPWLQDPEIQDSIPKFAVPASAFPPKNNKTRTKTNQDPEVTTPTDIDIQSRTPLLNQSSTGTDSENSTDLGILESPKKKPKQRHDGLPIDSNSSKRK